MSDSVQSHFEIVSISSLNRQLIHSVSGLYEAPNWSRDGNYFIVNHQGKLFRFDLDTKQLSTINTDFATRCNNDHGISPDGQQIVISHHDQQSDNASIIYILPISGGTPKPITPNGPSYWHGWSPDGARLAYVAGRQKQDYKIYSISVNGGEETQLTFGPGLDDGPDYSPDGKYIYFNAFRNQKMQIWRMENNGQNPEQVVFSDHSDWFPHPSPDGRHVVFLRYIEDQGQAHPFGRDVQLMLLNLGNQEVTPLTDIFFGGQGSINVPSWSPDSQQLAFVSYSKS